MTTTDFNPRYKNNEEMYRRIMKQFGCDSKGDQYYVLKDSGTSYLLENVRFRERQYISISIELPVAIERGATSQVNMMSCLTQFSDKQRDRGNDNNEDASYWDGLESMMSTLERFKKCRNILYAPKEGPKDSLRAQERDADLLYWRSGYTGENVRLVWTPDGPEYVYKIPTETEYDLSLLITDFRFDNNCIYRLDKSGREKWQLLDLYLER